MLKEMQNDASVSFPPLRSILKNFLSSKLRTASEIVLSKRKPNPLGVDKTRNTEHSGTYRNIAEHEKIKIIFIKKIIII